MTKLIRNTLRKLSLCALLLADLHTSKFNSEAIVQNLYCLESDINMDYGRYFNPDEKIYITSVTNLIVNKEGDVITFNGLTNALKHRKPYIVKTSELPDAYSKSTSELLMISGHHNEGYATFFDNGNNYFKLDSLPRNPSTKILVMRGCHTVMNPTFLDEESRRYVRCSADKYISTLLGFAPNLRLIIGYETKAPLTKDDALINIIQNLSIAENQGLKSYGEYALGINKKMFKYTGHEKDASGWRYKTMYSENSDEGTRIAYYLKESDGWKYYSLDNPQGVKIISKSRKSDL